MPIKPNCVTQRQSMDGDGFESSCENVPDVLALMNQRVLRVLRRFARNRAATWRLRVEIKNARVLMRVFERASSCDLVNRAQDLPVVRRTLSSAERQQRVLELKRRMSASITEPHQPLEWISGLKENQEDPEHIPDSSSSSECEERVSVESVVQKLFLQVEATKREAEVKDARILELEALVASLTCKNNQLRHQLQKVTPRHADSDQIDDRVSNQPVWE